MTWDEICKRASGNNKTVICVVEKRGDKRFFKTKCNLCDFEKEQRIDMFRNCQRCRVVKVSKDTPLFIEQSRKLHGNKYDYGDVFYKASYIKVPIRCTDCNTVFYQRPNNHLKGQGCPFCNESKGELYLKKILTENNIEFIPQHTFPGLANINALKCDVYVPIVNLIIEIDGDGHREAIFGSTPEAKQKNFEDTVRNDAIKDNDAKVNGINMLRIPYSRSDKDLSFIGEISMNCYNDLLKAKNPVQLTLDI